MNKQLMRIINSKTLYYVAVVIMVVNVLGYVLQGSIECTLVFALSYYILNSNAGIPKMYRKRSSLSILGGLFVSNVIFGCGKVKEGFTEGAVGGDAESPEDTAAANTETKETKETKEAAAAMAAAKKEIVDGVVRP